jgi:hypothetical protein
MREAQHRRPTGQGLHLAADQQQQSRHGSVWSQVVAVAREVPANVPANVMQFGRSLVARQQSATPLKGR